MTSENTAETTTPDTETAAPDTTETATPDALDALSSPAEIDDASRVREIDPRIKAFVDRGQKQTEAAPRKWFYVTLPESEVKRVTRDAKRYARETGRVFRVKHTDDPKRLVYRVVAKVSTVAAEKTETQASE